jgi:hypothetical protein
MFQSALLAIIAAATAYSNWVKWQRENEIDNLEDEIDKLAAIGNASAKLRMERLAKRLRRKSQSIGVV